MTPLSGIPTATLSSSAAMLGTERVNDIVADLADMETFAVVRASHRWNIPVIGIRAVSDNPGQLRSTDDWSSLLDKLDERLAEAIDRL
jgi:adenosylhomocysteine nucleosidase